MRNAQALSQADLADPSQQGCELRLLFLEPKAANLFGDDPLDLRV
jgi:hypothetical protein